MKKLAVVSLALLLLAVPMGCYGPQKVTYEWQNITDNFYAQNDPWIGGNIITAAVFGIVNQLTWVVDAVGANVYYFWIEDAFPVGSGKSTPAVHKNPSKPAGK